MTPSALTSLRAALLVAVLMCLARLLSAQPSPVPSETVGLVLSDTAAAPVRHGLGQLKLALERTGTRVNEVSSLQAAASATVVVAGLTSGVGDAAKLIAGLRLAPPTEPESLLIRKVNREGKTVVLAAGADARGLMYALLDVAERVGWAKSAQHPFSEVSPWSPPGTKTSIERSSRRGTSRPPGT